MSFLCKQIVWEVMLKNMLCTQHIMQLTQICKATDVFQQ